MKRKKAPSRHCLTSLGHVETVKVIMDHFTRRSKGFGFVEMPSNSEADQAIKALNGKRIDGSNIKVNPADPGGKKRPKKSSFRKNRYESPRIMISSILNLSSANTACGILAGMMSISPDETSVVLPPIVTRARPSRI